MPEHLDHARLQEIQAKALVHGFNHLNESELLILLLAESPKCLEVVHYLNKNFANLLEIANTPTETLLASSDLSKTHVFRLKAALALAQYLIAQRASERPIIQRPADIIGLVQMRFVGLLQEHLVVVLLDAHNRVMEVETVYIGSLHTTVVRVAEIFRLAILRNSASIVLVHNHPSGKALASDEDISLTQDMVAAGKLLDIALMDHLIIGDGEWLSLREHGLGF